MNITNEIREEVLCYLELDEDTKYEDYTDEFYSFYYRCKQADMHYADADRYAILNTMFDYDIGMDNARAIDQWMYWHDEDIYELYATKTEDKEKVIMAVRDMNLNLDFSNWITEEYVEYKFFEN